MYNLTLKFNTLLLKKNYSLKKAKNERQIQITNDTQNVVIENETNTLSLFKSAFSTESLLTAYYQIKNNPKNVTTGYYSDTFKGVNLK